MIYFWDNGEPGYDGHDVLIVESDAPVEDVLALLSAKGQVVAMAEVVITSYRVSLADLWRRRYWVSHYMDDAGGTCASWKEEVVATVHEDCNCESRPIIDAAIRLGLVPAKNTAGPL